MSDEAAAAALPATTAISEIEINGRIATALKREGRSISASSPPTGQGLLNKQKRRPQRTAFPYIMTLMDQRE